ncbi:MAG: hypothetical protein WCJ70_04645 [bacterium]
MKSKDLVKKVTSRQTLRKIDAFDAVAELKLQILEHKPTPQYMRRDIQMSSLLIRPQVGDVFTLNMGNDQFIDALWSILKIDEFVGDTVRKLPRKDVELFYKLSNHVRQTYQDTLNRVDMRLPHLKEKGTVQPIAIEIFRSATRSSRRIH